MRSYISLLFSLLFISCSAIPLVNDTTQLNIKTRKKYHLIQDLKYSGSNHPQQKLDLYYPLEKGDKSWPLVLYYHGGGYRAGDKQDFTARKLASAFVQRGYAFASVNYPLFPQTWSYQKIIKKSRMAVQYLRANADTFNIDPEKIGAWGDSAGSGIVADLSLSGNQYAENHPGEASPVLQAGLTYGLPYRRNGTNFLWIKILLPVDQADTNDPPIYILHGKKDKVLPYYMSGHFYQDIKHAYPGRDEELILNLVPGLEHSDAVYKLGESNFIDFFDRHLKP